MDKTTRAQHPVLRPIDDKELARESWKIFQIMGEFVEGFERLARIRPSVSIFGSARTPTDHPLYALTVDIARKLSDAGFAVVSGGGPGLMERRSRRQIPQYRPEYPTAQRTKRQCLSGYFPVFPPLLFPQSHVRQARLGLCGHARWFWNTG